MPDLPEISAVLEPPASAQKLMQVSEVAGILKTGQAEPNMLDKYKHVLAMLPKDTLIIV